MLLVFGLLACEERAPEETPVAAGENGAGNAGAAHVVTLTFRGDWDPERAELSMHLDPPAPGSPLYCERRVTSGRPDTLSLDTRAASIDTTVSGCGFPFEFPYDTLGMFCATVDLTSHFAVRIEDAFAEILTVSPDTGHNGYRHPYGTGADLATVVPGAGAPSDLSGGLWAYGALDPGETVARSWTFEYQPEPFSFEGRIVVAVPERRDGADDNCDGNVDEAPYASGEACATDAECYHGWCDAGVCVDPRVACPAGLWGPDCTQVCACDDGLYCNGEEVCDARAGCLPGSPPAIDDGYPCTLDYCDEARDEVRHAPICDPITCGVRASHPPLACAEGEICTRPDPFADSECVDASCPGDLPRDPSNNNLCVSDCGDISVCAGPGGTGQWWPLTSSTGDCVCETVDGWFVDPAVSAAPQPCDGDGDGWVRASASAALEGGDPAVAANARCAVRRVDGVVLENELGERLLLEPADAIPLYEPDAVDAQASIDADPVAFPPLASGGAGTGRAPVAEELNALTKMCVSSDADFNQNGVADVAEGHRTTATAWPGELNVLQPFTYFAELHRSWVEAEGAGGFRLVISEARRCEGELPVRYRDAASDRSAYAHHCVRGRSVTFGEAADGIGEDFGQHTCEAASAGCDVGSPPVLDLDLDGAPDPLTLGTLPESDAVVPVRGCVPRGATPRTCRYDVAVSDWVCDDGAPLGSSWRGMGHASQFACVQRVDALPADRDAMPYQVLASELAGTGPAPFVLNACTSSGEPTAPVFAPDGTVSASWTCTPERDVETIASVDVGWAASRHHLARTPVAGGQSCLSDADCGVATRCEGAAVDTPGRCLPTSGYVRGCVDESAPCTGAGCAVTNEAWTARCASVSAGGRASGDPGRFGKLSCACPVGLAASDCSVACPSGRQLIAEDFALVSASGSRSGYWACGTVDALGRSTGGSVGLCESGVCQPTPDRTAWSEAGYRVVGSAGEGRSQPGASLRCGDGTICAAGDICGDGSDCARRALTGGVTIGGDTVTFSVR